MYNLWFGETFLTKNQGLQNKKQAFQITYK